MTVLTFVCCYEIWTEAKQIVHQTQPSHPYVLLYIMNVRLCPPLALNICNNKLSLNSRRNNIWFESHSALMQSSTKRCHLRQYFMRILVRHEGKDTVSTDFAYIFLKCLSAAYLKCIKHSEKHPLRRFFTLWLSEFSILQSLNSVERQG